MTATVQSAASPAATTTIQSANRRPTVVRAWASRTPKWQRFQPVRIQPSELAAGGSTSVEAKQKEVYTYQRQYSHVYHHRLTALRDRCWKQLEEHDNKDTAANDDSADVVRVNRILELKENQLSRIVGTLVKETGNDDEEPLHPTATCRPSDQLYLEDESGRVVLSLDTTSGTSSSASTASNNRLYHNYQFCTGVVVGIEGTVDEKGVLHVHKVAPPAHVPPPNLAVNNNNNDNAAGIVTPSQPAQHDPHLLLVSSLECGDPQVSSLPREMLVGYLQGQFTDTAAKVARVIVAGSGPSSVDPLGGLKELDMFLGLQLSGRSSGGVGMQIPVDVMPSSNDPTTANWPQRPMHSSLLPISTNESNQRMVISTPNPYEAIHGTQVVLGTDGLGVRDLRKRILKPNVVKAHDSGGGNDDNDLTMPLPLTELEGLEQTFRWAHLCPTGPDHLGMVPTNDPMIMGGTTSHIFFCGNSEQGFATKILGDALYGVANKTRLVCIPKFSETAEAVLVNLKTLDVEILRFDSHVQDAEDGADE